MTGEVGLKEMENSKRGFQKQILSFSCFDPIGNQGGVSKVVREHTQMFLNTGYCYTLLFPIAKIRTKLWGNVTNGKFQSLIATDDLYEIISKNGILTEIHLHHFMRMDIDAVAEIVGKYDVPVKFFVHDFHSICPSINFIDSEGKYCGDSPINEAKCSHCTIYRSARQHHERIRKFYKDLKDRLTVVAPSGYALSVWLKAFKEIQCRTAVVPLQKMEGLYERNHCTRKSNEPLRIAYVGSCVALKGYAQWKAAVADCLNEKRNYRFFVFGNMHQKINGVMAVPVNVKKNPTDMIDKLRKYEIDVAVLNSICGETYSYTFHECFAANIYVITSRISGNIEANVRNRENGVVLERPDDLADFLLCEDELRSHVLQFQEKCLSPERLVPNEDIVKMTSDMERQNPMETIVMKRYSGYIFSLYKQFMTIGYRAVRFLKEVSG